MEDAHAPLCWPYNVGRIVQACPGKLLASPGPMLFCVSSSGRERISVWGMKQESFSLPAVLMGG
jgi:hypothetical protein